MNNNYFMYAVVLMWAGIILGLLTFATLGTNFILSGVVMWARIVAQALGVASLFAMGLFFHWMSKRVEAMEKK